MLICAKVEQIEIEKLIVIILQFFFLNFHLWHNATLSNGSEELSKCILIKMSFYGHENLWVFRKVHSQISIF